MSDYLKPGERLDDLQCNGLKLIQRPDVFRFGTDSVLTGRWIWAVAPGPSRC